MRKLTLSLVLLAACSTTQPPGMQPSKSTVGKEDGVTRDAGSESSDAATTTVALDAGRPPALDLGPGTSDGGGKTVDPNSLWDLYVDDGMVPSTQPDGTSWIGASLPDPQVFVYVGPKTGDTSPVSGNTDYVKATVTPKWDTAVLTGIAAYQLQALVSAEIYSHNTFSTDDVIGPCALHAADLDFAGGKMVCSNASVGYYIDMHLVAHP